MGNNDKSSLESRGAKLPRWAKLIMGIIGGEILNVIFHIIFQNIGLGEAFLKFPLLIWRGLLFNFNIPVWLYVVAASFPFLIFYIVRRAFSTEENEAEAERKKEEDKNEAIEKFKSLIKQTKELGYRNSNELDKLKKRTEMYIRKTFGKDSHYLFEFKDIYFSSPVVSATNEEFAKDLEFAFGGSNTFDRQSTQEPNERNCWEDGKARLINLLEVVIESLKSHSLF